MIQSATMRPPRFKCAFVDDAGLRSFVSATPTKRAGWTFVSGRGAEARAKHLTERQVRRFAQYLAKWGLTAACASASRGA